MNINTTQSATPNPLCAYTIRQIVERLHDALTIARSDLATQQQRFHALLDDVRTRAAALDLAPAPSPDTDDPPPDRNADDSPPANVSSGAQPPTAASDHAQPPAQFTVSALTNAEHQPVSEFLLIPFGDITVERPVAGADFIFTPDHAAQAKRWFDAMQRKLAIDYEHQSFNRHNTRADGLRPAAGWIGGLEVRDDGLWATDVQWTDRARELLRTSEYRYFSPVIFWTDEDQTRVAALGPVALTNDPAMRGVKPLAASRNLDGAVGNPADVADPADVDVAGVAPVFADTTAADLPDDQSLQAAHQEIALLRRQLAVQEADTFVERGLRQGKVTESTSMDWRNDYLRDPQGAAERLDRAPILLPPGRLVALDRRGHVAPLRSATVDDPAPRADRVEAADLEAYDRATAAGRVRHAGVPTLPTTTRTNL